MLLPVDGGAGKKRELCMPAVAPYCFLRTVPKQHRCPLVNGTPVPRSETDKRGDDDGKQNDGSWRVHLQEQAAYENPRAKRDALGTAEAEYPSGAIQWREPVGAFLG
jgi:hypothetical protein